MFPSTQICAMILLYLTAPVSCEESVSEVPRMTLWDIIMSLMQSQSLAKTMPSLVTFLPNLLGGVLTNVLELMIEYGKRLMGMNEPEASEISGRSSGGSLLGGLFQWDVLDTGLRLLRVGRSCRSKAACECGSYLFHQNRRLARSLRFMRSNLEHVSIHWPALMTGVRGGVCSESYPECRENFVGTS